MKGVKRPNLKSQKAGGCKLSFALSKNSQCGY